MNTKRHLNDDVIIQNRSSYFKDKFITSPVTTFSANKSTEEYFKELAISFENADVAIICSSQDGTIKTWNKASEKMLGFTSKEVIGKDVSMLIPSKCINDEKIVFDKISNNKIVVNHESTRWSKSGKSLAVSISLSPLQNNTGSIVGVCTIIRDNTIQKKLERTLHTANKAISFQNSEREKRAAELLIANLELAYENKEKHKRAEELLIANKELAYQNKEKENRAEELLIANLELAYQNNEKQKRAEELLVANKELSFQNQEKENRAAELLIANAELAYQNNEKQKRANELSIANDELAFLNMQQQAFFASIVNSSDDAMLSKTLDGIITSWNVGAEKIFGYTAEEIIGKNVKILIPMQLQYEENNIIKKIKNDEAIKNYRTERLNKNGSVIQASLTITPIKDFKGNIIGASKILRDIKEIKKAETEQKLVELQLIELNKNLQNHIKKLALSNEELEHFAYVASHDLQEPLRMVTNFLTQLERKYGDVIDDKGKKYIGFAVDGAKRMRQIILDLLEYSKIGKNIEASISTDLNIIIEEVQILLADKIADKKAILIVPKLPKINADISPLRQVFQNLISNALEYSSKELPVQIEVAVIEYAEFWQFAVADNGIGINKAYFEKIFQIFQRLHSKEEHTGTGLGLAITKKIIETQGGLIWVESEEGRGSTFYFTIKKIP